ncbi:MAG TPA: rhombotarget lipoprotein, partial [Thermoanaerobaculia bacterium]|nr:rhombotarget lipoprotein [Thermoanaerobaculia bacterium]
MKLPRLLILLVVALPVLSGCSHSRSIQRRSDLMSYLYPAAQEAPTPNPGGVVLQLPLKLGIAFVPGGSTQAGCARCPQRRPVPAASEKELLDIVRKAFAGRDWISQTVIIPSAYLRPEGGFENLRQAARMHGVDVVALVSVDQVQSSYPEKVSFLYLSVIGAYVLPLDQHDTQTLIDAAAFHVPSGTFLLRAPGVSTVKGRASMVDLSRDMA